MEGCFTTEVSGLARVEADRYLLLVAFINAGNNLSLLFQRIQRFVQGRKTDFDVRLNTLVKQSAGNLLLAQNLQNVIL